MKRISLLVLVLLLAVHSGSWFRRRRRRPPPPSPVHGGWTSWGPYDSCGQLCGGSTQHRTRSCTNPSPAHGGRSCPGASIETRSCNTQPCPVNGRWSNWGVYSICSKSCGGGNQRRSRLCTNPSPAHGGQDCSGVPSESRNCNIHSCPAGNHLVDLKFIALATGIAVLAIVVVVAVLRIKKRNMQVHP